MVEQSLERGPCFLQAADMSWRPFVQWKPTDVARWLTRNGLSEYADRFIEEEVNGRALLGLTPPLIAALIPKIGGQAEFNYILDILKSENPNNVLADHVPVRVVKTETNPVSVDVVQDTSSDSHITLSPTTFEAPSDIVSEDALTDDDVIITENANSLTSPNDNASNLIDQPSTSTIRPRFVSNELSFKSDYATFILSTIPEGLSSRLDQPDSIIQYHLKSGRSPEKSQLIRSVYEQLLKITLYPSSQQYRQAALSLVTRYPILTDTSKTGFDNWAKSLKDRFKNQRRFMTDNPVVLLRKQNRASYQSEHGLEYVLGTGPQISAPWPKRAKLDSSVDDEVDDVKMVYQPHSALNIQPNNDRRTDGQSGL